MRRKALLIAGLIALAASLIGPAVQAAITNDAGWWGHMSGYGQMSGYGHMGWWGEGQAATEFSFSPDELTVEVGEPVNLTLINTGDLSHDLVIPDLGVHLAASPGRQATAGIEIEEAGSYRFLCSLPGHAEAGMAGLLTVKSQP